jgi:hypothetical protein
MPYIVTGEPSSWKENYFQKDSYSYKYPNGLDFRPGTELHDKIRNKIWEYSRLSRNEMSKRFSSWRETDKILTTYICPDDKDKKSEAKDKNKPVKIVFPYSYSMLEALLTYLSMAFFQSPMFKYEGVEDDDTVGAMLMEMVINLHCVKNKVILPVHTVLRDSLAYGVGVGIPEWKRRYGKKIIKSSVITESGLGSEEQIFKNTVDTLLFEGNSLSNIDPYMYLPDPTVSSVNTQDGEFVGWIDRTNYMNLLSEENESDSSLFNVKYLKHKKDKRSTLSLDQSDRQMKFGKTDNRTTNSGTLSPVDRIRMYITIIPKDWKLGNSEVPEKWYFELASDDIVIACEPANHNHGMYPVAVASPEFDGYSPTPIGRMEIIYGLQHTLDFLFNSHIENVKKAINDMLIVDPYLVNIKDLEDPQPGKLIRLRRPAWGRGVDKVVQQLQVTDITRMNISDSAYITQWMDRISGADQSMQGALRQGGPERLTSGEFQGTRSSAMSRLQRLAMIISTQFMQDIGTMFAVHSQQYMEQAAYVQITGRYAEQMVKNFGSNKKRVNPDDLLINYDLVVGDGSIPGGNFSSAWLDLFKTIGTTPELMQQFDVTRIFTYIAQQLGAKNVEDFRRNINQMQTQQMPDQQVMQQVQAGNLVPTGVPQ